MPNDYEPSDDRLSEPAKTQIHAVNVAAEDREDAETEKLAAEPSDTEEG